MILTAARFTWHWLQTEPGQTFLATVAGALAGAWAAFSLDGRRRAAEEKRRKIAAGNIALVTLNSMWFELSTYESQVVRPKIAIANAPIPLWLGVPPAVMRDSGYKFDIAGLAFLLQSSTPEVLPELIVQADRYGDFHRGLEMRDAALARAHERMEAMSTLV